MWNIRKVIVTLFLAGLLGFGSTVPRLVAADALQYTLKDLEEAAQSLDQYRNQWVVVNFWATWCGPCIREIPELMAFAKRYPEQVQVLGIAFEKTPVDEIRAFVAEFGVSYPRIPDRQPTPVADGAAQGTAVHLSGFTLWAGGAFARWTCYRGRIGRVAGSVR